MKRWLLWLLLIPTPLFAANNYEVLDKDISQKFGKKALAPVDSRPFTVFIASANITQLNEYSLYGGSVTIPAATAVIIAPVVLTSLLIPIFSEQNTSSKTVSCQAWGSSFTLTNTSGVDSKIVNWLGFGRRR